MILDKKQMTEEDIKLNYITPAINASCWRNGKAVKLARFKCILMQFSLIRLLLVGY